MITPELLLAAPLVQQATGWIRRLPIIKMIPAVFVSWFMAGILALILDASGLTPETPLLMDMILMGGGSNVFHEFRKRAFGQSELEKE